MLTAKQHHTLEFIRDYFQEHGYAPTESEIATGIGIKSRGVVHRYVTALAQSGFIRLTPHRRRNIVLLNDPNGQLGLPILGKIAAGRPLEVIETQQVFNVAETLLGANRFILEVRGDSMIGDNICDGDYIICEKRQEIRKNDIAVAVIDNQETTLKRIQPNTNGTVSLIPSNPQQQPMIYQADRVHIQGIYLGLIRLDETQVTL